ncbi:MAG: DUF2277 domain-containing protein [Chloroflexi bacterium]|nr:DUF2277 domain-containing protein [Chloroflexota bacterium]
MCRSIVTLRRQDGAASQDEVRAAALQFVRKISGYRVPSRANEEAFNLAVEEIAAASRRLLGALARRETVVSARIRKAAGTRADEPGRPLTLPRAL